MIDEPLRCDECGQTMLKAQRVERGHHYCMNCYQREFTHQTCATCEKVARILRTEANPVCRPCKNSKPCVRCGKTDFNIGKITEYGPVCTPCARYFGDLKPCEQCEKPSRSLTRVARFSHSLKVCLKCSRADFATCNSCFRYRLLTRSTDGHNQCKACATGGEIACPICTELMPAGLKSKCRKCSFSQTFERKVQISRNAFANPIFSDAFFDFASWYRDRVGIEKSAVYITQYVSFFLELEALSPVIPIYEQLLSKFGDAQLRRSLLVMKWMRERHGVKKKVAMAKIDSELRTIESLVASAPETSLARTALGRYRDFLMVKEKAGKTSIRSVRLAITPAAALVRRTISNHGSLPSQNDLDSFLTKVPGQRAAVTGFANFLNRAFGLELLVPEKSQTPAVGWKKPAEKILVDLLNEVPRKGDFRKRWITASLKYFHSIAKTTAAAAIELKNEAADGTVFSVRIGERIYSIPEPQQIVRPICK